MKKQNVRTLSLIVCTLTYLLIGAAIFDSIESEEEQRQKEALESNFFIHDSLILSYSPSELEEQLKSKYNITKQDFILMEEIIHLWQPFKAGMPWKFAGSFYYATTVLTTIGYGHSTPKTDGGKFFTMVYAIIGIPLGLIMFNSIGERLNNFSSIVINKIRRLLKAKQKETTESDLILVASTLSFIVVFTGAATFSHYEGWTYFNSIYYCFVTLTTIGFGDLVALQQDNALQTKPEYVTFALFFIMFGLAIIAASLNLMVLKFMMLNTEDEKRDEQQAIQAAAQTVRVDGDVILQRNEDLQWKAENVESMDEGRSVCSCSMGCYPLSRFPALLNSSTDPYGSKADTADTEVIVEREEILWRNRLSHHRRGFLFLPQNRRQQQQQRRRQTFGCDLNLKAESFHDLRRSTMCSILRLPSPPPPRDRCSSVVPRSLSPSYRIEQAFSTGILPNTSPYSSSSTSTSKTSRWLKPFAKIWRTFSGDQNEDEDYESSVEIRYSGFALDEIDSFHVLPKDKNLHHHKRVSL